MDVLVGGGEMGVESLMFKREIRYIFSAEAVVGGGVAYFVVTGGRGGGTESGTVCGFNHVL